MQNRWLVPFINVGHLLDHLVMLVFPTAVLALAHEWGRPYAELLPLALGSFICFGAFAIPAGAVVRLDLISFKEHSPWNPVS